MSDSKKKAPTKGMWEVQFIEKLKHVEIGEKRIYHASTAATLEAKGHVKILKEIKKYVPKTMKE